MESNAEILTATLGGHATMYGSTVDPSTVPYLIGRGERKEIGRLLKIHLMIEV